MMTNVTVYADLRFDAETGIGKVQQALVDRRPAWVELVDLDVPGRYGHPLSPLRITRQLRRARPGGPSVFWSCGFIPPLASPVPVAVTVHDLTHLSHYGAAKRNYFNRVLRPLYRRCDAVFCVSEHTRSEFLDWSRLPAERVHVVHNGIDSRYLDNSDAASMGFPYLFYAGNHRPYKNLHRLIRAFGRSALPEENVHFVLTGHCEADLAGTIEESGVQQHVHFLGRVPEDDIPAYYRGALAVPYVSLNEGFGLPILEAMASGTAVITSDVSSMPEVAGDAALLVDPYSEDAIAEALTRVVRDDDLRARLVGRGLQRLQLFKWEDSARILWERLGRVARQGA